jgi:hypothetical protein
VRGTAHLVVPRRRYALGAEELIELGQTSQSVRPLSATGRTVFVSPEEGRLLVKVIENVVSFAKDYPVEFHSYCPTDRWQKALEQVGTWTQEIEKQLEKGMTQVAVPAEAVFHLVDLEKCVSAARDARLSSAKVAFTLSAVGAIADVVLGITWIGIPMYIAGLGLLFGRPLYAKYQAEPQEPYKPSLGADCHKDLGDHTDKRKILERVIVRRGPVEKHYWGEVWPTGGRQEDAVCLAKDRFRVRIEGWSGDRVVPAIGWRRAPLSDCDGRRELVVWGPCEIEPRATKWGKVPPDSGFEDTYWVEYTGPLTGGICRRAGPFG